MAVLKLSQIAAAVSPVATDTAVGVQAGTTDAQYTLNQLSGFPPISANVWGQPDSVTPTAQTFQMQSAAAGTVNVAGGNWIFNLAKSTGNASPGILEFNGGFTGVTTAATCTISIASPAVFTENGHGFVPGQVVQFSTTGALPAPIVPGINYYVIDAGWSANNFQISATPFGAAINTTGATQSGVHTCTPQTNVQNPLQPSVIFGPAGLTGGQTTPTLQVNQWWNTSGGVDATLLVNVAGDVTNVASTAKAFDLQFAGTSYMNFTILDANLSSTLNLGTTTGNCRLVFHPGQAYVIGNSFGDVLLGNITDSNLLVCRAGAPLRVKLGGAVALAWATGDPENTGTDTAFYRDAAVGVIGLSKYTSGATALRIYKSTDHTGDGIAPGNYERLALDFGITTADLATIGTQALGTGTVRDFAIVKGANIYFTSQVYTVGTLPAVGNKGARAFVTDGSVVAAGNFGTVVAGGGANNVPVYDDGTNWRIG